MTRPTLLLSLLLSSSTLTACGSDDPPDAGDAKFSTLSEERRGEAIGFAMGDGAVIPYFAMLFADAAHATDEACPARAQAGAVTTYTADDCTNDGQRYDGRIVATNAFTFGDLFEDTDLDPAAPMSIELEAWTGGDLELDGRLTQSRAQPSDGQAYTGTVDYAAALAGQAIALRGTTACVQGESCTVEGFADTPDGSFAFEGELSLWGERPRGWITLRGVEVLHLDLDALDADGCAPYTIDDRVAGSYCFDQPEPAPAIEITGGGIGCGGTDDVYELDVLASVKGTPATVSVRVIEPATGIEEEFGELPELSYDAESDIHNFQLTVPQSESALARCTDREYVYAITATTADGESACASFGDHPELFPDCPAWL